MIAGAAVSRTAAVDVIYDSLCYLAGVPLKSFFLDDDACIAAFRDGAKALRALYGELVPPPRPSCPHLSYGHAACLGAHLSYPEDAEPWVAPLYRDLDEGIDALGRACRFEDQPLFRRYLSTYAALRSALPGTVRRFAGLGWEGPVTTAVLLRGQPFFEDVMDRPADARRFLDLVADSTVAFAHATRRVDGLPPVDPNGSGMADDFASFLPPRAWPELVLPVWERFYRGLTSGRRTLHIEGMGVDHLPFLRRARIEHVELCVSPRLTVRDMVACGGVPFRWLLPSFHLRNASDSEIEAWATAAYGDGAGELHTELSAFMLREGRGERIRAFVEGCARAAATLARRRPRQAEPA